MIILRLSLRIRALRRRSRPLCQSDLTQAEIFQAPLGSHQPDNSGLAHDTVKYVDHCVPRTSFPARPILSFAQHG